MARAAAPARRPVSTVTPSPIFLPLRELAAHVRAGHISPVALTEEFLGRLETLGPRFNAVVTVTRERALQEARRAETEIAAGRWRGPLHGIPYGAKDLFATAGRIPTSWGAAPLRARLRRRRHGDPALEAAGAVLVAKLAMVELAGGVGYRQPRASFTGPDALRGARTRGAAAPRAARAPPWPQGSCPSRSAPRPGDRSSRRPANCGVTGLRPTLRPGQPPRRHGARVEPRQVGRSDSPPTTAARAGGDRRARPAGSHADGRMFCYDGEDPPGRRFRFGVSARRWTSREPDVRAASTSRSRCCGRSARSRTYAPGAPLRGDQRTILFAEAASAFEGLVEFGASPS